MKRLTRFFFKERNIMTGIALNAVVIFLLSFPSFSHNFALILIDDAFIIFFLMEAIFKIKILKFKRYWSNIWNRFDFLVAIGCLPLLSPLLLTTIEAQGIDPFFVLMLRLLRLLRLSRFFWFVPNLAHLLKGLARAFKASIFVLIILLFFNFILSILTTHFYSNIAPKYFGDPLRSFYTIFQLFTVEGWNEIPEAIAQSSSNSWFDNLTRFYFALIVLIGGIFGMSLANAIFVDEMTIDNTEKVEKKLEKMEKQLEELKQLLEKK